MTPAETRLQAAPRNKQTPIKLPNGFELVAVAYGDPQHEDHLSIVLGRRHSPATADYAAHTEYVTWNCNHSILSVSGSPLSTCGNGNYFSTRSGRTDSEAAAAAWEDFFERAKYLIRWRS